MRAARVGEIEIIGVSFATDGEGSSRTPIYSLAFGNAHPAEVRARLEQPVRDVRARCDAVDPRMA